MRIAKQALVSTMVVWVIGCGGKTLPFDPVDPTPSSPVTPPPDPPAPTPAPPPTTPAPTPDPEAASSNGLAPNTCLALITATSVRNPKLATVNLATGYVARGPTVKLQTDHTLDPSSLAAVGNEAIFCDHNRIIRADRSTGSVTVHERECSAITADENGIYVLPQIGQSVLRYDDVAALAAGSPATKVGMMPGSILGVGPKGLLSTWYSGSKVVVSPVGILDLEAYDGPIFGVSGATGGRIVISVPNAKDGAPGLLGFDAVTGRRLGALATLAAQSMNDSSGELGFKGITCAY